MNENKLRKVVLSGHGYAGLEVHFESPSSRGGMEVKSFNKKKDPIAIPPKLIDQIQRVKYYWMLLFSMISSDDEIYLTDIGDSVDHKKMNEDNSGDPDRMAEIITLAQRVFVTKIELDEDNNISISADYSMLEGRVKNYSTTRISPDDEFARYYDMIKVSREIFDSVSEYAFSEKSQNELMADVKEVLMKLMPGRQDEIKEMDEDERRELYRSHLESKGYVVIGQEDMSDSPEDNDSGTIDEADEDEMVSPPADNGQDDGDQSPVGKIPSNGNEPNDMPEEKVQAIPTTENFE